MRLGPPGQRAGGGHLRFYKKAKSMTDVYLLNMAVADILFVLTLPFWAVHHATGEWIFSNAMCKLARGIYAVNFNCGMLLLTCISLDRYIAIVQATKSFRLRSRTLAHHKAICLAVWTMSILISSSTFTFNQKYKLQGSDVCEPRYHSVAEPLRWKLLVLGLQLLFGFFIPLVFMIFCYMFIVKTLVQAQNSKRHKAIRVILAVVLVFLACQIPHNMVLLVTAVNLGRTDRSCGSERALGYARNITEVLAFLHCCLNPVLYAFIGQKFRSYFLKIMKDLWCVRRKQKAPGFSCSGCTRRPSPPGRTARPRTTTIRPPSPCDGGGAVHLRAGETRARGAWTGRTEQRSFPAGSGPRAPPPAAASRLAPAGTPWDPVPASWLATEQALGSAG
uniref:C-C motif chemokine receptor 6 n=2 Tax=Sus scrofa TaxID=9823 RepID=A0A4X1VXE8_PIG